MRFLILPLLILAVLGMMAMIVIPIWIAMMLFVWRFVLPWLVVALIVWIAFALAAEPRRARWGRSAYPPASPARRPTPSSSAPVPVRPPPATPSRPELPIDVQVKIEQIRRKAEVLLGYASRFPPFSRDLYLVRQTATDYLPRTIDAYLALPAGQGDRIVMASGKTALQELKEQLNLLDAKLDEIAEDLQRQDLSRLLANRRFLEERFGRTAPRTGDG